MIPKTNRMLLGADDIDRLIQLSSEMILANPAHAPFAREAALRVRNDQADEGAPAELLSRIDRYIDSLLYSDVNETGLEFESLPERSRQ